MQTKRKKKLEYYKSVNLTASFVKVHVIVETLARVSHFC